MNIWIFSSGDYESNEFVDPYFIGSIKKKDFKDIFYSHI